MPLAACVGIFIGLILAVTSDTPQHLYERLRYNVRDGLGLEKNWVKLPGPEQADGRIERSCPAIDEALVLVTGGQSNASNAIPVRYEVKRDVSIWFDGRCFPASDPMLGATASGGSLWSVLGDQLEENIDRPILLIAGAVGGTQFSDWLDDRSGYYEALIQRVSTARDAGYMPDLILWHQGETDAEAERNLDALEDDVTSVTNRLLADIPTAPLYLFQATRCIGQHRVNGVPEVVEVMKKVADANTRIITGMNTDVLGRDYRWDTCHFNTLARETIIKQITPDLLGILKPAG